MPSKHKNQVCHGGKIILKSDLSQHEDNTKGAFVGAIVNKCYG